MEHAKLGFPAGTEPRAVPEPAVAEASAGAEPGLETVAPRAAWPATAPAAAAGVTSDPDGQQDHPGGDDQDEARDHPQTPVPDEGQPEKQQCDGKAGE